MRIPLEQRDVLFIDEVAARLGMSRRAIDKLRRYGAFPIPEIPKVDNRPRWSKRAVAAFIEERKTGRELLRLAKSA